MGVWPGWLISDPPTVFGVGCWPRGRLDVTGVRRGHGDPPQTSVLGAGSHGAPCSYLGKQMDINHFSQQRAIPSLPIPGTSAERATKTPFLAGSALAPVCRETF